jgi:ABC-type transport system involved in multi-copper enzyme maturation permease subunit
MTFLPIVGRELRVASRRSITYQMRVTAALAAMVMFGWMTLALLQGVPPTMHGRYLFRVLFGFAFVYSLFIGARLTAECLSEEKRDGTLGLLFLTDLTGHDVVFGKLAATSINSVYALLASIPVIALSLQLGGVTAGDVGRSALVLLNTLFLSTAAGVFVSALSRNERKAMFAAVFLVLVLTFGPLLFSFALGPTEAWPFLALSPAYAPGYVLAAVNLSPTTPNPYYFSSGGFTAGGLPSGTTMLSFFPVPKASFWWSVLMVHLLGWCMLLLASRILPRVWQSRVSNSRLDRQRQRVEQWAYGRSEARKRHRARLLDINPFLWLVSRERWKPYYAWLYVAAVSGTWLWGWWKYSDVMFEKKTLVPTILLFQTFFKVWIISEACTRLAEDRRIGALELLLSTPLTTREILRGQWLALRRQFAKPVLVVVLIEFLLLRGQFPLPVVIAGLVMLVADMVVLGWVGMWLGLTARSLNRAIVGTIGRVLVVPWGAFAVGMYALALGSSLLRIAPFESNDRFGVFFWFAIGLACDFAFGVCWARRHLLRDFREAATQRYQGESTGRFGQSFRRKEVILTRAPIAAS